MNKGMIFQGQSLFDKTVEAAGDVELTFETALMNGVSVTESFAIGTTVVFPAVQRKSIVGLFGFNRPASALSINQENVLMPELGIGSMAIGTTFIIG